MMIFALSKGHFSPSLRFFVDKIKKAKSPKCPILRYVCRKGDKATVGMFLCPQTNLLGDLVVYVN